ncbi:MAG TPA: hypothetical protein VM735_10850 [Candidatus Kapabacteria bacterium]|nr:hypothetical protein [Candidatus Kapabacteria bacterium]
MNNDNNAGGSSHQPAPENQASTLESDFLNRGITVDTVDLTPLWTLLADEVRLLLALPDWSEATFGDNSELQAIWRQQKAELKRFSELPNLNLSEAEWLETLRSELQKKEAAATRLKTVSEEESKDIKLKVYLQQIIAVGMLKANDDRSVRSSALGEETYLNRKLKNFFEKSPSAKKTRALEIRQFATTTRVGFYRAASMQRQGPASMSEAPEFNASRQSQPRAFSSPYAQPTEPLRATPGFIEGGRDPSAVPLTPQPATPTPHPINLEDIAYGVHRQKQDLEAMFKSATFHFDGTEYALTTYWQESLLRASSQVEAIQKSFQQVSTLRHNFDQLLAQQPALAQDASWRTFSKELQSLSNAAENSLAQVRYWESTSRQALAQHAVDTMDQKYRNFLSIQEAVRNHHGNLLAICQHQSALEQTAIEKLTDFRMSSESAQRRIHDAEQSYRNDGWGVVSRFYANTWVRDQVKGEILKSHFPAPAPSQERQTPFQNIPPQLASYTPVPSTPQSDRQHQSGLMAFHLRSDHRKRPFNVSPPRNQTENSRSSGEHGEGSSARPYKRMTPVDWDSRRSQTSVEGRGFVDAGSSASMAAYGFGEPTYNVSQHPMDVEGGAIEPDLVGPIGIGRPSEGLLERRPEETISRGVPGHVSAHHMAQTLENGQYDSWEKLKVAYSNSVDNDFTEGKINDETATLYKEVAVRFIEYTNKVHPGNTPESPDQVMKVIQDWLITPNQVRRVKPAGQSAPSKNKMYPAFAQMAHMQFPKFRFEISKALVVPLLNNKQQEELNSFKRQFGDACAAVGREHQYLLPRLEPFYRTLCKELNTELPLEVLRPPIDSGEKKWRLEAIMKTHFASPEYLKASDAAKAQQQTAIARFIDVLVNGKIDINNSVAMAEPRETNQQANRQEPPRRGRS